MIKVYQIKYDEDSIQELVNLTPTIQKRIIKKITWLGNNFDIIKHTSLTGEWSNFYKLRIGDYRVIYYFDVSDKIIFIIKIGHRREIYD